MPNAAFGITNLGVDPLRYRDIQLPQELTQLITKRFLSLSVRLFLLTLCLAVTACSDTPSVSDVENAIKKQAGGDDGWMVVVDVENLKIWQGESPSSWVASSDVTLKSTIDQKEFDQALAKAALSSNRLEQREFGMLRMLMQMKFGDLEKDKLYYVQRVDVLAYTQNGLEIVESN